MTRSRNLRIAYLSGPVDARGVYDAWSGNRALSYFGTSYLSQYFQLCSERDADGYVVTIHSGDRYSVRCGNFVVDNRPLPENLKHVIYHLGIAYWFVRWLPRLIRFKPDVLIVTAFQNHWFLLCFLRWFGITIIPSAHCVFWPRFEKPKRYYKVLDWLNRNLFWPQVKNAIAVSEEISQQMRALTNASVRTCLPTYSPDQFGGIHAPRTANPFRVFFAGRIEESKGVFDVLAIARRLESERAGEFHFDICGEGGALEALRASNPPPNFVIHGVCCPSKLLSILGQSDVVIVPTRTTFEEGLPKVCVEGVLAGRPVVTSAVCPALRIIEEAAIEVPPNDVNAYYKAILLLREDPELYRKKCEACLPLQARFYDANNSWGAHMRRALSDCGYPA